MNATGVYLVEAVTSQQAIQRFIHLTVQRKCKVHLILSELILLKSNFDGKTLAKQFREIDKQTRFVNESS